MHKLIVSIQVSLDGVLEAPERWAAPFWDDPSAYRYALDELRGAGALLMGRRTYEGFLGYWPQAPSDDPMTARMNELPKYVASTTLEAPEWNATVIGSPCRRPWPSSSGAPAATSSCSEAASSSTRWLRTVSSTSIGSGSRPRSQAAGGASSRTPPSRATLRLTESRTLPSGVVVLFYTIGRGGGA